MLARLLTRARRTRGPVRPPRRVVLAPTADAVLLLGTQHRQQLLFTADRSPSLFQLVPPGPDGQVQVLDAADRTVGHLAEPVATAYRRRLARARRRGEQWWVHGQVVREGLDLQVVLHCPPS